MFAALGKNDQKLYIIPSQNMVVVPMGNAANEEAFALSDFDHTLWEKIGNLTCITNTQTLESDDLELLISPNPVKDQLNIITDEPISVARIFNIKGQLVHSARTTSIDTQTLTAGIYILSLKLANGQVTRKRFIVGK